MGIGISFASWDSSSTIIPGTRTGKNYGALAPAPAQPAPADAKREAPAVAAPAPAPTDPAPPPTATVAPAPIGGAGGTGAEQLAAAGGAGNGTNQTADAAEPTDEQIEAIWAKAYDVKIPPGGKIPQLRLPGTPYTIMRKSVNWFRAHDQCRKHGMNLATFPTLESYTEVATQIFEFSVFDEEETHEFLGARRYWLNDLAAEGEWRWIDTGELLTYPFPGGPSKQPDHVTKLATLLHPSPRKLSPEHCGLMWNPNFETSKPTSLQMHTWDDCTCTGDGRYYYFICQDYVETPKVY